MKVVLLHPLPLDDRVWAEVVPQLDQPTLAPPLYGLGDDLVAWAEACLELAGSEPLVLVGNSIGGSCAIEMARLAPEQVRHLVLVGAKAGHRPEPAVRDEALRVLREQGLEQAWQQYWQPLVGPNATDELRHRLGGWAIEQRAEDIMSGVSAFHGRADRASFLRSWNGMVTMVAGQHDIAPGRAAQTARELRNGRFVLLPGIGHYAPVEAPEALTEVVHQILRQAS